MHIQFTAHSLGVCPICHRAARGFGWRLPRQFRDGSFYRTRSTEEIQASRRRFCSMRCQDVFYFYVQKGRDMTQLTENEIKAAQATLRPLGDYVGKIGFEKGFGQYTKEEIEGLVGTIIYEYHRNLERLNSEDIPF